MAKSSLIQSFLAKNKPSLKIGLDPKAGFTNFIFLIACYRKNLHYLRDEGKFKCKTKTG